ncbi:MAG: hypothetical protein BRC54_04265, partial [Cyanobacteria bacterium SW_7_48_12]
NGGDWGLEKQLHYLRDLTQGEDKSRIRTTPLPPNWGACQKCSYESLLRCSIYQDGSGTGKMWIGPGAGLISF